MASGLDDAVGGLLRASHLAQARDLDDLLLDAASRLGCSGARLYLVDYDQLQLIPLTQDGVEPIAVEGTVAGRAFGDVALHVVELSVEADADIDPTWVVWAPLLDGTERHGVVRFERTTKPDEDDLEALTHLSSLIAFVLVSKQQVGDVIERTRRTLPMSLPAEMQWRLLPPLTYATHDVVVSGLVLPTHDVAGDSFDYAVNGSVAHVAIMDAMGHGLDATLQASVAMGALRNARRSGLSLLDAVHSIDTTLGQAFGNDRFVTAIIGELELDSGTWTWVSAGHPPALLLRGTKAVKQLDNGRTTPLGLEWERNIHVGVERLEPGDSILLYTDGVLEARDDSGEQFGVERLADFVARALADGRPAPETLRRLNHAILEHQAGLLQDDATTLIVEWRGLGSGRLVL